MVKIINFMFFLITIYLKKKRSSSSNSLKSTCALVLMDLSSLELYQDVNEPGLDYWRLQDHISADSQSATRQLTSHQPTQQPITDTCMGHSKDLLSLTQICRSPQMKTALYIFELSKSLLFGGNF